MVTFNDDKILGEYLTPKGAILINVNPGILKLFSINVVFKRLVGQTPIANYTSYFIIHIFA